MGRRRPFNTLAPMVDPAIELRNRFAIVKGAWEDHLPGASFPSLGEGTAEQKIERLELAFVDELFKRADADNAKRIADAMWSIVHARPDSDRVKVRATEPHQPLARMGPRRF